MKVITIVLFFAVAFVSALPTEDKSVLNTLSNIDVEQPEVDGELIREIRQYGGYGGGGYGNYGRGGYGGFGGGGYGGYGGGGGRGYGGRGYGGGRGGYGGGGYGGGGYGR